MSLVLKNIISRDHQIEILDPPVKKSCFLGTDIHKQLEELLQAECSPFFSDSFLISRFYHLLIVLNLFRRG